ADAPLLAHFPSARPAVDRHGRDWGCARDPGRGRDPCQPDHRDCARRRPDGAAGDGPHDVGFPELVERARRSSRAAYPQGGRDRMINLDREPILRVMPGPTDINANGHIFGGWVLSQMDIAAGIVARIRSNGPVATVAIERMEFIAPIHLRDLISVYAHVERVGRTSTGVRIEVVAHRDR